MGLHKRANLNIAVALAVMAAALLLFIGTGAAQLLLSKTWTTQADFAAGVLNNVDVTSQPEM